jgi:hypothetical protein
MTNARVHRCSDDGFIDPIRQRNAHRIRNRLALRFDSVQQRKYLDMRTLLIARLFVRSPGCRAALIDIAERWQPDLSDFEKALVAAHIR